MNTSANQRKVGRGANRESVRGAEFEQKPKKTKEDASTGSDLRERVSPVPRPERGCPGHLRDPGTLPLGEDRRV